MTDGTGTAYVYVRNDPTLNLDAFEIDVTNGDTSVIQFTVAQLQNPTLGPFGDRWDSPTAATATAGASNLLGVAINANGVDTGFAAFDPDYDGVADAFLLAQINYNIVGVGTSVLNLTAGSRGFFSNDSPDELLDPTFASGTITVIPEVIPEPSSVGILALGLMGLLARRKRS